MNITIPPDEPNDNVVPFVVPLLSESYRRAGYMDRRDNHHRHGPYVIDDKERTVACQECKKVIDPIMCLLEIADQWRTYHKPRLAAIKEYREVRKAADENFDAWWSRIGKGRTYPTKKVAAQEAWIVAAAPELKAVEAIAGDLPEPESPTSAKR